MMPGQVQIRRAVPRDAFEIVDLYQRIYSGTYTDPMMAHTSLLRSALERTFEFYWVVGSVDDRIVGSVVYRYDAANRLAKVFGAVVEPEFRGHDLTENLMTYGYEKLREFPSPVEVVYTTTRTVSPAPQRLTANLGYRKMGIFPNVHKTEGYETHCLAALYSPEAMAKRFTDFALHPKVRPLYEIVRRECGLDPIPSEWNGSTTGLGLNDGSHSSSTSTSAASSALDDELELEAVHAPKFAKRRFDDEKKNQSLKEYQCFFPFHEPNLLLTSPDQQVEAFCYFSQADKHCVLIGLRDAPGFGLVRVLNDACDTLHDMGARYLEFIVRADEAEKIDRAIQAGFIPCAYFPAMHLNGGLRYDYVVFSRSYEILNFRHIRLEGVNREYLHQYLNLWKEIALEPEPLRTG